MSLRNVSTEQSSRLYATPRWPTRLLLANIKTPLPGGRWFEPNAGDGGIIAAVLEVRRDVEWTAAEIDGRHAKRLERLIPAHRVIIGDVTGDAFSRRHLDYFQVSLTNAAFPIALQVARICKAMSTWTCMLERLDWLETPDRRDFFTEDEPDLYVLPNRPKFRGRTTDSGGYAWFVWGPTTRGKLYHLPSVPLSVRQENRHQLRLVDDEGC